MRRFTLSSAVTLVASGVVDAQRQCGDHESFVHSKVSHLPKGANNGEVGQHGGTENQGHAPLDSAECR